MLWKEVLSSARMAVFVVVLYHMDRAILVEKGDQLEPAITETGPECDESGKRISKTFTVRDLDESGRDVEVSKPFDGTVLFTTSGKLFVKLCLWG